MMHHNSEITVKYKKNFLKLGTRIRGVAYKNKKAADISTQHPRFKVSNTISFQ
jgi:hypothetical protein